MLTQENVPVPKITTGPGGARHSAADDIPLLRVRLLGGFRVECVDDGRMVCGWQRRSGKTLTKLLAVQPGHALHREQILDILWPGTDAESSLNSFGKALHAARRALEPQLPRRHGSAYLRMTDAMVALNLAHIIVDTDEFERLAQDALHRGAIDSYEAALASYGGDLLPEDRYDSWCTERGSFLTELRIRLLLGMAEELERRGAHNDAADRLREVLRREPAREVAHRRLMRLYAQMGTPDQAVRQFQLCENALRRELDLAPQPETRALYDEIVADQLLPQRSGGSDPAREQVGLHRSSVAETAIGGPLVGRERVLQRMCDQLMRRNRSRTGMIVVSGEPGVGKTRLLEELASRAAEEGATVLSGGSGAHASQFVCGPFAVALEGYAASRPAAGRAKLARAYPALARFVPSVEAVGLPSESPPSLGDSHLIPHIARFLVDLTRTQPVLLILGDLNGIDAVSLGLVRYLAHLAAGMPMLIAGALRGFDIGADAGLGRMIEAMTREHLLLRIELHCLPRPGCDRLVQALLPGIQVSDGVLAEIHAQSRGNPLFVRDLVHDITEHGDGARRGGGPGPASSLPGRVMSRTRALTAMRLALMDQPLRRVLGLAAAVGAQEISLSQLRAGAAALEPPVAAPALFDALDRALRMNLLEDRGTGYAFRHPILRSALYDCLPRHRRDELHGALAPVAGALRDQPPRNPPC